MQARLLAWARRQSFGCPALAFAAFAASLPTSAFDARASVGPALPPGLAAFSFQAKLPAGHDSLFIGGISTASATQGMSLKQSKLTVA